MHDLGKYTLAFQRRIRDDYGKVDHATAGAKMAVTLATPSNSKHRTSDLLAAMADNGFVSRVHRKKPKGRPMPENTRRANNAKSKIRSRVGHVFADQKTRIGLVVRTIGIARTTTKIWLVTSSTTSDGCSSFNGKPPL